MPGPSFSNYSIHLGVRVKTGEAIIIKSWRVSQLSYGLPQLEKGKTWLGKIGWKKHSKIELAYSILRIRSLNNRFWFYLNQLNKHGYINYESVRIYNNGIVEQGSKRVDLTVAEKRKLLSFGRVSRFGDRYDPFLVQMSESGFGLFDKKILFETYTDADIIRFILGELAKGRPLRYGS